MKFITSSAFCVLGFVTYTNGAPVNIPDGATVPWQGLDWINKNNNNYFLDDGSVQIAGAYHQGKGFFTSVDTFARPLTVEVDMRIPDGGYQECLGIQVFPDENCDSHACAYTMGLGWWVNKVGITYSGSSHSPYGSNGDPYQWHTVKIVLPESGDNEYYYDGELRLTHNDLTKTEGKLRFRACATGDYKNLIINGVAHTDSDLQYAVDGNDVYRCSIADGIATNCRINTADNRKTFDFTDAPALSFSEASSFSATTPDGWQWSDDGGITIGSTGSQTFKFASKCDCK